MSFILPTTTDGTEAYDVRTQLEGVDYTFQFRFNFRRELWSFTIRALDGTPLLTGQSVHVGIFLNRRAVNGPPGLLMAIGETDDLTPPGLHELGERVKLYYLTKAEVAELEAR